MEDEPKPWLLRVQLDHTPSFNDPIGASEFYKALGIAVVAWGRLENHFLACIMAILANKETKWQAQKLPMAWAERERIWKDAFNMSPSLKPHEPAALAFLAEMHDVAEHRSRLVHGLWEPFNPPTARLPISAGLVVLSHRKKTKCGVDFWRGSVGIVHLKEVSQEADRLNIELLALSAILTAAQPPIPSDIQKP
jgi:hypothetical protein